MSINARIDKIRRHHYPWWDWAHRVMILLARDPDDAVDVPRGRDLWWIPTEYVEGLAVPLVADLEQRFGCYITTRYSDVRLTSGDIDWRIYDLQDEGRTVKVAQYPNRPEHPAAQPERHCQLQRRHRGAHRFRNYTWRVNGQVEYQPTGATA